MDQQSPVQTSNPENSLFSIPKFKVAAVCFALAVLLALLPVPFVRPASTKTFSSPIVISEAMTNNSGSYSTALFKSPDWIELHNTSNTPVSLFGYALTDSLKDMQKYIFPDVVLSGGGYLVVFASADNVMKDVCVTGFKLNKTGETLYLIDPFASVVQTITIPALNANISYAIGSDGTYGFCNKATPGMQNNAAILTNQPDEAAAAKPLADPGGLYISEVCAASQGPDRDWVELHNASGSDISLAGYFLSDDENAPKKWKLPDIHITAGGYVAIDTSPKSADESVAPFGIAPFETLGLRDPNGNCIDLMETESILKGITCGRVLKNGVLANAYFLEPTKAKPNAQTCYSGFTSSPAFSDTSLYHTAAFSASLVCQTPGAEIFFTTDGSLPTDKSALYSEPIQIEKNTCIRAIAVKDGLLNSACTSVTYLFDAPHTVPVFCLSGKASEMNVVLDTDKHDYKPEFAASVCYYEADGTLGTSFPSGVRPKGKSTIKLPQNSITIALRSEYGQKAVTYPFFSGNPMAFSNLTLRNGGQDSAASRLRDSFFHRICNGINVDTVESRPVVLYINGAYCGLYDLVEEQNEDYFSSRYHVGRDDVLMAGHKAMVITGDAAEYKKIEEIARTSNTADNAVFAEFAKLVDIDACTDFLVAQIYFGNGDITNSRFWCTKDGTVKWRPVYFDLDYNLRFNKADRNVFDRYFEQRPGIGGVTVEGSEMTTEMYIFCALYKNKAWRDSFVERFVQLSVTQFDAKRILPILDQMAAQLLLEMPGQAARWKRPHSVESWQNETAKLRNAIDQRQAIVYKQLQRYFKVSDEALRVLIQKYTAVY